MLSFDFMKLPEEIKLLIILFLPPSELARCRQVCKQWNDMIKTSAAAQYALELATYGLVPCLSKNWTTAAALQRVREQQEGWRRCRWKTQKIINLRENCKTYELRSGVWAFGHCETTAESTHMRLLPLDYTTTITCFKLPSGISGDAEDGLEQWSLSGLEMSIRDFTIDPLIDLIVLVEQVIDSGQESRYPFRLHLRNLSDGRPHPLVTQSIIPIELASANPLECLFNIQLQETSLGVLIKQHAAMLNEPDYLAIWNWQTGDLELTMSSDATPYDDFAFIDSCSIMLAAVETPATLRVYCFENSKVYFAGAFEFPHVKDEFVYIELHFDSGPSASVAGPGSVDGTPYSLTPTPDILAITFGIVEALPFGPDEVTGFTMITSPRLMLDKLKQKTAPIPRAQMRDELRVLAWEDWGPSCTRWLPQRLDYLNWQPSMQGGRFAVIASASIASQDEDIQDEEDNHLGLSRRKQVIRVYDFRSGAIFHNIRKGLVEGIQLSPTLIPKSEIFEYDVCSRLPYHMAESEPLHVPVSGVMIDEGRLVCTRAEENDEWRQLLVLTF